MLFFIFQKLTIEKIYQLILSSLTDLPWSLINTLSLSLIISVLSWILYDNVIFCYQIDIYIVFIAWPLFHQYYSVSHFFFTLVFFTQTWNTELDETPCCNLFIVICFVLVYYTFFFKCAFALFCWAIDYCLLGDFIYWNRSFAVTLYYIFVKSVKNILCTYLGLNSQS